MTLIAPHIAAFLQQRLPVERQASPNTCDSYAHAFRLLFEYASSCLKITPSQLQVEHIDAPLIVAFLNHLEATRGNGAGSRNIRLAAIKSFMRYIEYRLPSALEQIRCILSIPTKKTDVRLVRTSRHRRCNPFWMLLIQHAGSVFVIAPCCTFVSPVDCECQNWWAFASLTLDSSLSLTC
jgi:hypothetical protein